MNAPPGFPVEEYLGAVKRETFVRDAAFIEVTQDICGFEVRKLTVEDFCALRLLRSPFLVGGDPTPADARAFLWKLSPTYTPKNTIVRGRFMRKCRVFLPPLNPIIVAEWPRGWMLDLWAMKSIAALNKFGEVLKGIREYVAESLQDWGSSKADGSHISYFSDTAAIVGMISREYGWEEKAILKLPMARALQYMKEIRSSHGQKALFNASDRISFEWMKQRNAN